MTVKKRSCHINKNVPSREMNNVTYYNRTGLKTSGGSLLLAALRLY